MGSLFSFKVCINHSCLYKRQCYRYNAKPEKDIEQIYEIFSFPGSHGACFISLKEELERQKKEGKDAKGNL